MITKIKKTRLVIFDGNKGGVGKSQAAKTRVDHDIMRGMRIAILECDTQNPDLYHTYAKNNVPVSTFDIANPDEWMKIFDKMGNNVSEYDEFVMSMPAGSGRFLREHKDMLIKLITTLDLETEVIWMMGRTKFSHLQLAEFLKDFKEVITHINVCLNTYFGGVEKFERWKKSGVRKKFIEYSLKEPGKFKISEYPELPAAVEMEIEAEIGIGIELIPYSKGFEVLSFGYKMYLEDFFNKIEKVFDKKYQDKNLMRL